MLKEYSKALALSGFCSFNIHSKCKKKRPPPVLHTGSGQAKQTPFLKLMFQVPLNIISHWGWLCYTHFHERTGDIMRNPNGFGTVARLSGNRRRPFIIKKVVGWNNKGHPIYDIVGYAATREEGLMILSEYNRDPWDVDRAKITMKELFEFWKEKKDSSWGKS